MFSMIRYHLILNLRERTMVFWTLAFPILLGTFFYFGIGGIDASNQFEPIPAAVIGLHGDENAEQPGKQEIFQEFLDGVTGEMILPEYDRTMEEAEKQLENGEIAGIFKIDGEEFSLILGKKGINESILTAMLDGFEQQTAVMEDIKNNLPKDLESQKAYGELVESLKNQTRDYVSEVSLGGKDVSSVTTYYFALLAMACLYMCFLGETAAKRTQANISEIGKRICVSPVHRLKVVLANGISAYILALVNIGIVMLFLIKGVHGMDISMHPGYAVITAMMGCLIGITFGILIESIGKWSQNIKTAILIGSSIFCAFLAGLMIGTMKDIIEKHVPIINRLNPAALIADSFYCICVYDDLHRLQMNLCIMGVMSAVFLIAAWVLTRRVRYDSL